MPTPLTPVTLTPGITSPTPLINLGAIQAVKLTNGSPFDLTVTGFGASGGGLIVPAGMEYMLHAEDGNDGYLSILPVNNNNVTGTGVANLVVYLVNERLPKGSWPATVPVQIVQAKVSTVTVLVNDGNALGTQIIESTPSGAASSTISILNDGTVTIKGDVAGVLTTLLQLVPGAAGGASSVVLSDASRRVEVLGSLLVDGSSIFTGDATFNGAGTGLAVTNNETVGGTLVVTGDATFNGAGNGITVANNVDIAGVETVNTINTHSGNVLQLQEAGVSVLQITSAGPNLNANMSYKMLAGSISRFTGFSGTGNGTFNTNLGATPNQIAFNPCTVSGSSQTIGGTIAQSSVVTTGAGLAWGGIAFAP